MKVPQTVAVIAGMGLLAGCQSATNVGGRNDCGYEIEAKFSESEVPSYKYATVAPDESTYATSAIENPELVFLFVRRAGSDVVPAAVLVPEEAVDRDSDVFGVDWLITISGDLCPE